MTAATAPQTAATERDVVPAHALNGVLSSSRSASVRRGPLLAVCGVAGGVGVTTLSYLIARAAAREWSGPVLIADTGGPSGGLAACAGVEVARSFGQLAQDLAAGAPLGGGIYAVGRGGVRVLATGPEFSSLQADQSVGVLLTHAREAHGLTVIDCGTLARRLARSAAAEATHIAWVLTATKHGVATAGRVLAAAPAMAAKELVVARNEDRQATTPLRELRRVAAERGAPLVLLPRLTVPGDAGVEACAEEAQLPVQAILGALAR